MVASFMDDVISSVIDSVSGRLSGVVDFLLDPAWWHWIPMGLGIIGVCFVVGWFFPPVRSFAGAVVLAVIGFLIGYFQRRSEEASKKRRRK